MMFHTFNSQEERRKYGGSAFCEIQFCKLPRGTKKRQLNSLKNLVYWQNDSLYVDDVVLFYEEYKRIFKSLDVHSFEYYAPEMIDPLIEKLNDVKPVDYEVLAEWLNRAKEYNGFYFLGV